MNLSVLLAPRFAWLRDRIWPTLEGVAPEAPTSAKFRISDKADAAVIRLVVESLRCAVEAEEDRFKSADTKLIALCAMMPVSVTLLAAFVTFLSSGDVQKFTPESVTVITAIGAYVALQFLRALRAAIDGLQARGYLATTTADAQPDDHEDEATYLSRKAETLANRLNQHRHTNDDKISQLSLAYVAITNAVGGLLIALVSLAVIAAYEAWR